MKRAGVIDAPAISLLRHDPEKRSPVFGIMLTSNARAAKRRQDRTQEIAMPRKPGKNSEFVMFDVLYEDGTQRSNRKVPRELTGGIDGDKPAHGFLIEQDREIAEKSGNPPATIASISRSGAKRKDDDASWKRAG
jgi:hypothetical protein